MFGAEPFGTRMFVQQRAGGFVPNHEGNPIRLEIAKRHSKETALGLMDEFERLITPGGGAARAGELLAQPVTLH